MYFIVTLLPIEPTGIEIQEIFDKFYSVARLPIEPTGIEIAKIWD